jgi:hypothetical protein
MIAKTGELCGSVRLRTKTGRDSLRKGAAQIWFEVLESRRLMSAGVVIGADGIMTVTGTEVGDRITIFRDRNNPNQLVVGLGFLYQPGVDLPPRPPGSGAYDLSSIRGIRVNGMGGDDMISVLNAPFEPSEYWTIAVLDAYGQINIPVTLDGGAGDDELYSESNADDVMIGGPGRDHASVVGGHDLFAVETVENYRDIIGWSDGTGNFNLAGGMFDWHGPQDQLFADPWLVPNRQGTYLGPNAPHFDDTNTGGNSAADDSSKQSTVADTTTTTTTTTTGGSTNGTVTKGPASAALFATPPSLPLFSVTAVVPAHHHPWDDAAE